MISTNRGLYYPTLLLLSNDNKKTSEALAKTLKMSGDTVLRILKEETIDWNELITKAKEYFGTNKVKVIIDDTLIKKMYSQYIEGSCDNYDPVTKQVYRSICTIVAMLTDGKTAIPVLQELWFNSEFCPQDQYRTKTRIAQGSIEKLNTVVAIKIVIMDGLYATSEMVKWCNRNNIPFEMRFHSNRRIALDKDKPDDTVKVSECKELLPTGKKSCRTVKALWHGETVYITAVKHCNKDGSYKIVYQISNVKMKAPDHVFTYKQRWNIEEFHRTAKQSLGLKDCQSTNIHMQKSRIYTIFYMYAFLHHQKEVQKAPHIESVIRSLQTLKPKKLMAVLEDFNKIFIKDD